MITKFDLQVIPHEEQRYSTCGDYWEDNDTVHVRVSDMKNPHYHLLVLLHELVEWYLVHHHQIPIEQIDEFDKNFEKLREEGKVPADAEPGDDLNAPYRPMHQIATGIERMMAAILLVDWNKYNDAVMSL